jgi:phenylpropionate dioxygenase-like ring-hydroxylating dioxygenase large terminal subunit
MSERIIDSFTLNAWHVVAAVDELTPDKVKRTRLLSTPIVIMQASAGEVRAWIERRSPSEAAQSRTLLPLIEKHGYLWVSLGNPIRHIFSLPEIAEPDRKNVNTGAIGVNASAPRVIENFLDLGHLAFVHSGILGDESRSEVRDYDVEVSAERDEILATRCFIYQPKSSARATAAVEIEYVFRVPHPYCAVLYKSSSADPRRMDVIGVLVQPMDEERVCAHMLLSRIDHQSSETAIKAFQQTIFGQDKPILENQLPKRLPLNPRAEMPVRSDASSVAYRRWLREKGVTYGTLP